MMDIKILLEKVNMHYRAQLPFVLFSLSESNKVSAFLQQNNQLHQIENFNEKGFIFAPFEYNETALFIPENESDFFESELSNKEESLLPISIPDNSEEKNLYIEILKETIESIQKRKANKIVISRYRDFPLNNFSIGALAMSLFSIHPKAFRYIWFHPETGIWCGATPETLVQIENNAFTTMALAGTKLYTDEEPVLWGPKEIDEQQLVTDAITNNLQRVTSVLKVSKPYTHRTGSLLHLRTDITGVVKKGKATLTTIAATLHPTPAICGTPCKFAKEFILEHEKYGREYYTGFLGPIIEKDTAAILMVNLRCMKIVENNARIYVGGGITLGSMPEEEWQETKNKMQFMLQVLQPIL